MCNESIYKSALEEISSYGEDKATLSLSIAPKSNCDASKADAVAKLRSAIWALQDARKSNDESWSSSTDTHIDNAMSDIVDAIALL